MSAKGQEAVREAVREVMILKWFQNTMQTGTEKEMKSLLRKSERH